MEALREAAKHGFDPAHFRDQDPMRVAKLARALTLLFQLINCLEQREIVAVNRRRRKDSQAETIRAMVLDLKARGVSGKGLREVLRRVRIEPTLTAHPTEAKRRAVLEKLHRFVLLMDAPERSTLVEPLDDPGTHGELLNVITQLWLTE